MTQPVFAIVMPAGAPVRLKASGFVSLAFTQKESALPTVELTLAEVTEGALGAPIVTV